MNHTANDFISDDGSDPDAFVACPHCGATDIPPALCVPEQEFDIHDAPTSPGCDLSAEDDQ